MDKAFEKILERMDVENEFYNSAYVNDQYIREGINISKEIIKNIAEEYNGGWIPVSDRLPKKNGFYLATLDGEIVGEDKPFTSIAEFEDGKWVDDEDDYQCVLAWKKLPEPYKQNDKNG